jgi:hypothetical protein
VRGLFLVENNIKQKNRNRMKIENLDSIMHIGMEGPTSGFDSILMDAIVLMKNAIKFRFLFTNPEKYLSGVVVEVDDLEL